MSTRMDLVTNFILPLMLSIYLLFLLLLCCLWIVFPSVSLFLYHSHLPVPLSPHHSLLLFVNQLLCHSLHLSVSQFLHHFLLLFVSLILLSHYSQLFSVPLFLFFFTSFLTCFFKIFLSTTFFTSFFLATFTSSAFVSTFCLVIVHLLPYCCYHHRLLPSVLKVEGIPMHCLLSSKSSAMHSFIMLSLALSSAFFKHFVS